MMICCRLCYVLYSVEMLLAPCWITVLYCTTLYCMFSTFACSVTVTILCIYINEFLSDSNDEQKKI